MNAAQWIITAGGVVTAVGVIIKWVIRPIITWAMRLDKAISHVETHMVPNGGSSLRDAINRIESRVTRIEDYITKPW